MYSNYSDRLKDCFRNQVQSRYRQRSKDSTTGSGPATSDANHRALATACARIGRAAGER